MLFISFNFIACSQVKLHASGSDLPKEKSNIGDKKEMSGDTTKYKKAIFASGCFWGTEYYMQKAKGVVSTEVGFIGGTKDNPTYKEVCTGKTGHAEACLVVYNPDETNYEELTKLFFETHDPTQVNRQGPDIGTQYRTEIFYLDDEQKATAEKLIKILKDKGYDVVTKVTPATTFWKAEDYHQNYYENKNGTPYCHVYKKKFD
ncbi:MAG: peptide-methionine (S)-S-oxide reductase MsrA [Ignavibacteria bacterium]|nr:peptide-methionine (S)-S-oxide reductase MsrA [Ignavibacteria bacterium]